MQDYRLIEQELEEIISCLLESARNSDSRASSKLLMIANHIRKAQNIAIDESFKQRQDAVFKHQLNLTHVDTDWMWA